MELKAKLKAKEILLKHIFINRNDDYSKIFIRTRTTIDVYLEEREHALATVSIILKSPNIDKQYWEDVYDEITLLKRI